MQILVVFFLATLVGCFGDESECSQNVKSCMADYLQTIVESSSHLKQCIELTKTIDCLETAVESCAGDEDEDEVKRGLEKLKEDNENCAVHRVLSESNDEIQKCFEDIQEDILECAVDSAATVLEGLLHLSGEEDFNDRVKCGMFMGSAECGLQMIEEKCGPEAVREALEQLKVVPVEVVDACKAAGLPLNVGLLVEDKRKK